MAGADMSKQVQVMEVLKKEVRSLLVAAKEGLTPEQLEQEFMAMIGKPLPLSDLGFQSTLELVADMPEVVRVCPYEKGTFILKAIADETTKAIAQLVARQKRSTKAQKGTAWKAGAASPLKNSQSSPRRRRAPVLPATVKAELQDLLSSSPLLLMDFHKAFFRRFGRAFQYTQYGFFSMSEVLRSVSDVIVVEQTREGPLLTLKKCLASEIEKEEVLQGEGQEEVLQGKAQEEVLQGEAQEEVLQGEAQEEVLQGEEKEEVLQGEEKEEVLQGEEKEEVLQEEVLQATPAVEMPPLEPSCEMESFHLTAEEKGCGVLQEQLSQGVCRDSREPNWEFSLAAPAVEMPPLEPSCEMESFHLTAEEKSEPVEAQAVDLDDGFKQPQDLEQSLLAKLIMTPEIPPDAVQGRSLCSLPQLERRCLVGVFVEFIISPGQFYIHICSKDSSDKLQDMMIEMRHCYSNKLVSDRYIMPESSVRPGQLCCVTVSKWWYRVVIHRVISDQEVEVFYPDYGNLETVRKSWLRFLKWCYLKLPAQAVPCSLAWVKPVEGTWSNAATLLFKKLCGSKLLVGIVDEYVDGVLHLFLCDTSTKEDVYFHCVLRDGGCAEICGENIPSQGFKELNPSALYVQPSGNQENAELVEPDPHLQQESIDADSETARSKLEGDELCDQQWQLSAGKETQDDVQPLLDEVSVPKTTDQDPELAQENKNETPTELLAVVKTPHSLGEPSVPAVSFKSVEDFYASFLYSEQPAEISQDDPAQIEGFSNKAQPHEAVHPSVLLMAVPFMLDNHNTEEKMKNRDLPRSLAVGLCSASELSDQRPPQKLYVPPTSLSAVLAAARLTTSSDYFQWPLSLRKKV